MKIKIALMAVCLVPVLCARASWYDITFTQTGETDNYGSATPPSVTDAVGQIDVVHGFAVGGSLDVLTGPDAGMYKLVAGSGGDGVFVYDNVVYPNLHNGGFLDGTAGLLWSVSGTAGNSAEMNMWYNATANYGAPAGATVYTVLRLTIIPKRTVRPRLLRLCLRFPRSSPGLCWHCPSAPVPCGSCVEINPANF